MEYDWRTSITAIRAAAEILRDYDDLAAAERRRFLDAIVEESARLHRTCKRFAEVGSERSPLAVDAERFPASWSWSSAG